MNKLDQFLKLARTLNEELEIKPLLYGSLGLEQRLGMDLVAEDIDVLVPEVWLKGQWEVLCDCMHRNGYTLYDLHEHAFCKEGISTAFAVLESLVDFAGIEIAKIPEIRYNNICYLLLDLEDYKKVYTASSFDGYRKDKKHKNDAEKIRLITQIQQRLKRSE